MKNNELFVSVKSESPFPFEKCENFGIWRKFTIYRELFTIYDECPFEFVAVEFSTKSSENLDHFSKEKAKLVNPRAIAVGAEKLGESTKSQSQLAIGICMVKSKSVLSLVYFDPHAS